MLKFVSLWKFDDKRQSQTTAEERRRKMENNPLAKMHKRLGCYGCIFANPETVGKDACCGHEGSIEVDENGKCKVRKESPDGVSGMFPVE